MTLTFYVQLSLFIATLGSFGCGTGIAWSSPLLAKLDKNETCPDSSCENLQGMDNFTKDWIGPLFPLGAACSGPIAFFLLNKIGRKQTLLWLSAPMLLGYILLTITQMLDSLATLFLGRFAIGNAAINFEDALISGTFLFQNF